MIKRRGENGSGEAKQREGSGEATRRRAEATRQQWDDEDGNRTKKGIKEETEKRTEPDLGLYKNKTLSKRRLHRDRTNKQDKIVRPRLTEDSLWEQIINIVTWREHLHWPLNSVNMKIKELHQNYKGIFFLTSEKR